MKATIQEKPFEIVDLKAPEFFPGFPCTLEDAKAFLIGKMLEASEITRKKALEIIACQDADKLNENLSEYNYELKGTVQLA